MNLTQPPFDDIHVRRAMNWIIDKAALRQIWGGPLIGKIAGHIVPDSIFDNQLAEYDPYGTPGRPRQPREGEGRDEGLEVRHEARRHCAAQRPATTCSCSSTRASTYQRMLPIVEADAAKIGITFHVSTVAGAYPTLQTTSKNIAIATFPGWAKDYADALTFFQPLFERPHDHPAGKHELLAGRAEAVAGEVARRHREHPRRPERRPPARALRRARRPGPPLLLRGARQDADDEGRARGCRTSVHNAAHIVGPKVTQWQYDQFSGSTAYAHVAVCLTLASGGAARGRRGPSRGCRTSPSSTTRASGCARCR